MTTQERARELVEKLWHTDKESAVSLVTSFAASERLEDERIILECAEEEFSDHFQAWLKQRIAALERTAKGESQ